MTTDLTLADVLAHPVVKKMNPARWSFMRSEELPPELNPYANEGVSIKALFACGYPFQSLKVIPLFEMLRHDLVNGLYTGKSVLDVDSSGNTALAAALLARAFGFKRVNVVMSEDTPRMKQDVFGAFDWVNSILVPSGESVAARAVVEGQKDGHVHLNQYGHPTNALSHKEYTGPAIVQNLGRNIAFVSIAMGSGGTAKGVERYFLENYPFSFVIGARPMKGHVVPGTRDEHKMRAVVPECCLPVLRYVREVSQENAFSAMKQLQLFMEPSPGPSGALAYVALIKYIQQLQEEGNDIKALFSGKGVGFVCHDTSLLYGSV